MWAAGRESDKKSEETENILMERNDKLSQSRMRHETQTRTDSNCQSSDPALDFLMLARPWLTRKL